MAENITLARPYARAIFEIAQKDGTLPDWSQRLAALEQVVSEPQVAALIDAPEITPAQRAEVIIEILGKAIETHGANLVRLLADKQRLALVPAISQAYEALRADAEGVLKVGVRTAVVLGDQQKQKISTALGQRFSRKIELRCEQDPTLIGGAVISAGDIVIDGSLSSRLERLTAELVS